MKNILFWYAFVKNDITVAPIANNIPELQLVDFLIVIKNIPTIHTPIPTHCHVLTSVCPVKYKYSNKAIALKENTGIKIEMGNFTAP